jgi:hypothetical protein
MLYVRRPEVESEIAGLGALTDTELVSRCQIARREQAGYVSTEAVLYFLRARKIEGDNPTFKELFAVLNGRVLRALPKAETSDGKALSLSKQLIRDRIFDRFTEILLQDRLTYDDRLDYYEINFNGALAKLRSTAQRRVGLETNRSTTLESPEVEGEIKAEVEEALGGFDPLSAEALDDIHYRSRLDAAIDGLTPLQSRIVEMLRQGIPIDSNDSGVVTIRGTLGKSEKTIRNQRDKAFATLRVALTEREKP